MVHAISSLLRLAVASPRKQFVDEKCKYDLAYITPNLIVCSMPTTNYVRTFYRISAEDLKAFLYRHHGKNWKIWNFRAEDQKSYDYSDFDYRVEKFPFPDHNPPPFKLFPQVIDSIDKFLASNTDNVAVLHCKAGQGRSGTMACAYLMASQGKSREEAIHLFTVKRMRQGFGQGVSILSQRRYLQYVEDWLKIGCLYHNEMLVEIEEINIYGMQYPDLEIKCCAFDEASEAILTKYKFTHRDIVDSSDNGQNITLRPENLRLYMGPDVQVSFQHSKRSSLTGLSLLHSTSYIWFNTFFESYINLQNKIHANWDELDGIIGTHKRGSMALTSFEVKWKIVSTLPFVIQTS